MRVRMATLSDLEPILELLYSAFGKIRYDETFAPQWVDCVLRNPLIFPTFVAIGEQDNIVGYIVWKVKQVSNEHRIIIELQELTAISGPRKLETEKLLFEKSPHEIIAGISTVERMSIKSCALRVWIHHQDAQSKNSVFYSPESIFGKYLGAIEHEYARGGVMSLYEQEHNCSVLCDQKT